MGIGGRAWPATSGLMLADGGSASASSPTASRDTAPDHEAELLSAGATKQRILAASVGNSARKPAPATTSPLLGKVVVIDPGHNGNNYRHLPEINRKVFIGNGTKACNTTGTSTNAGYSEGAFTFDVAVRLAALLRNEGRTSC
jgi:N-acetylmuramoyl-L-alanine amidase